MPAIIDVTKDLEALDTSLTNLVPGSPDDQGPAIQALCDYISYIDGGNPGHPHRYVWEPGYYQTAQPLRIQRVEGGPVWQGGGSLLSARYTAPTLNGGACIIPHPNYSDMEQPLLTLAGCTGAIFDGMSFADPVTLDGQPWAIGVKVGLRSDYYSGHGSGWKTFRNCQFTGFAEADFDVVGTIGNSEDLFEHCLFGEAPIGYRNKNAQAFWPQFSQCYWYYCDLCVLLDVVGDLVFSGCGLTYCHWFLAFKELAINAPGITISGLTIDGNSGMLRPKYIKQIGIEDPNESTDGGNIGVIHIKGGHDSRANGGVRGTYAMVEDDGAGLAKLTLGSDYLQPGYTTRIIPDEIIKLIGGSYQGDHKIVEVLEQATGISKATCPADGTATSIFLASGLSLSGGEHIYLNKGTGKGQSRQVETYDDVTGEAVVSAPWNTIPDTTSQYLLSTPLVLVVDTPFVTEDTADEWMDGEPLFSLKGGVYLNVEDFAFIFGGDLAAFGKREPLPGYLDPEDNTPSTVDYGRLVHLKPGNWSRGLASYARFARVADLMENAPQSTVDLEYDPADPQGTKSAIVTLIQGEDGTPPYQTDVRDWQSYYRFEDCWSLHVDRPPWSVANYREAGDMTVELLEADETIDTSKTPWELVKLKKGTSEELGRKKLYDVNGNPIQDSSTVVGRAIEVTTGAQERKDSA